MNTTDAKEDPARPLRRDLLDAARYYLRGWRGPVLLGALAIVAGAVLSWSWLLAIGIAPLILTALPCVAMCSLGLCMNKKGGKSCSSADDKSNEQARTQISVASSEPR